MTTEATPITTEAEPVAALATASARPQGPSVHMRALITWLAIFPLVSIGMLLLGPFMEPWHPVLRALILTAFVVPTAVYLVVPRMLAGHGVLSRKIAARSALRTARKSA